MCWRDLGVAPSIGPGDTLGMRSRWIDANWTRAACIMLAIVSVASAQSQQPAAAPKYPPPLTGSVVGYVVCEETELPIRFAQISLVPRPADADLLRVEDQTVASDTPKPHLARVLGVSDVEGHFRMDGVPAGDYFAGALMSGYVMPGTSANTDATGDQLKRLIASLPTVHVAAGQVASVNVTLNRGAVISGRVQFADGSPAIGIAVQKELAETAMNSKAARLARPSPLQQIMQEFAYDMHNQHGVVTDDEGRYRIFGLQPGKYIVSTSITSQHGPTAQVLLSDGSSPDSSERIYRYPGMTAVYEPGVFRLKDATVFDIRGEEQVMNADLMIDPNGLHTVKGKVVAGEDRHVVQAILSVQEDGKDIARFAPTEEDGSFQIDYLPSGSYTLVVTGGSDMTVPGSMTEAPQVGRMYQTAKLAVTVGEHDVVLDDLLLTPLKPGEKMEWPF